MFDPARVEDWIQTYLTIPNERGHVVRFMLYPQQKLMAKNQTCRDIVVKGRQTRASSFLLARNFRRMVTEFGLTQIVMAESESTTAKFRARIKHHLRDMARAGFEFQFDVDNDNELVISGLENRYVWASAEQRVVGRGYSAQIVHASEVAHWPAENAGLILGGILPAVPDPPYGVVDMESTPLGAEGLFYDHVMDSAPINSLGIFTTHLYPWWLEPRYTVDRLEDAELPPHYGNVIASLKESFSPKPDEERLMAAHQLTPGQIIWRRIKAQELGRTAMPFLQEYVESLDTCFIARSGGFFQSPDGIDHISLHRENVVPPIRVMSHLEYHNANISFEGPNFFVWQFPNPKNAYAIYQDTSKGGTTPESDPSVIMVIDATSMQIVAKLVVRAAPRNVAEMGCAIGAYYNTALYGGERDSWGDQALRRVQELHYPNVYYHHDASARKDAVEAWIYPTEANRNKMLQMFRERVMDHSFISRDATLWMECGRFTWQQTGDHWKAKAKGKRTHDDHVMAAAGAAMIADRARYQKPKPQGDNILDLDIGQYGVVLRPKTVGPQPWMR